VSNLDLYAPQAAATMPADTSHIASAYAAWGNYKAAMGQVVNPTNRANVMAARTIARTGMPAQVPLRLNSSGLAAQYQTPGVPLAPPGLTQGLGRK